MTAPVPTPAASRLRLKARAASAGTGKTTAIVGDVLRALEDTPLRRIAVVTFTQAGAADLRLRLEAGLKTLLETGEYFDYRVYPTQKVKLEAALLELGGATVTTIHGFFRKLLKLCAPDLSLDPDFENTDELESEALFRDAATQALSEVVFSETGAGKRLVAELGWDGALEALLALRGSRAYSPLKATGLLETDLLQLYHRVSHSTWARQGGRSLDPDDVEEQTLRLLEFPELLTRVRGRYTRLLIDEFQDVNPVQARIFERLNIAQTQMVGDPKQSIYAFRNADVDAFLRLFSSAEKLPQLSHSYRHGPRLAKLYSELADRFFPDFAEAGIYNGVEGKGADGFEQPLEFAILEAPNLDTGRKAEATHLALRFLELSAQFAWSDMAVLIRTRSSLPVLTSALREFEIPFVVQGGIGFFMRREIRDAALLLGARAHAARWLLEAPRPDEESALAALGQLPTVASNLPVKGGDWLEYLEQTPRLKSLLEHISHASAETAAFLRQMWELLPLEGDFSEPLAGANLQGLLRELALRGLSEPASAARFLESARGQRESDEPLGTSDAVKILTVHSSKGLEFPVCAVFDLSRESGGSRGRVLVHPLEGAVTLRGSDLYRRTVEHLNVREAGESLRLLYVALTRPKELLLLTGTLSGRSARGWMKTLEPFLRNPPAECKVVYLSAEEVLSGARLEGERGSRGAVPEGLRSGPARKVPQLGQDSMGQGSRGAREDVSARVQDVASDELTSELASRRLERPLPLLASPSRQLGDSRTLPRSTYTLPQIPDISRVLGVLTHAAIAGNIEPHNIERLRHQLILGPYPLEEREVLLSETRILLEHYARIYPLERRAGRSKDFAELPFCFSGAGRVWNGILDRLYLENNTWTLEDFKTDSPPQGELPEYLEHYAPQLALYREAVRRAWGVTPTVVLCFLRLEQTVEMPDDVLERAWQKILTGEVSSVLTQEDE